MGAHTTAWTVHADTVSRVLVGCRLSKAIAVLHELFTRAASSPAMRFLPRMLPTQQRLLLDAHQRVGATLSGALGAKTDAETLSWLQRLVNDYLAFVNFLPLSSVWKRRPMSREAPPAYS
jgi:hypothetical protein